MIVPVRAQFSHNSYGAVARRTPDESHVYMALHN